MKKLLLLLVFATSAVKAQIPSPLATQLQNVLNNAVASGGNNGVSAHLKLQNGQTWSGTAGVNGQGISITDTTVFHGASTTKLNVAILMLMLQENNLIDLDSTWHKYAPTLNVAFDTNITIRQLLNHTSGIKDYLEDPANYHYITSSFGAFYTPQYILENIVSGVPDFAAGTNFNYSSSNYLLAAYIAEKVTGNPVETELRNRIWNPLGMKHTYFGGHDSIPDPRAGVWWNFGSGVTNYSNQPTTSMLSYAYGGGNIVSCPKDLVRLVDTLLTGQLLSVQSMNEMKTFVPQSFASTQWVAGYGLGIHHFLGQHVDTLLGHDGDYTNMTDVFHSNMCGFTLATMTNTETLFEGIYQSMYNVLRNYYQCNAIPVANFYSTPRTTCPGTTITFTDSSTNIRPTSWQWNFPGGTLTGGTTLTDSMPKVIYATPGVYAVSFTASTTAGSSSVVKNSYITINSNVPSYNTAFSEGFETASLPNSDWNLSNTAGLNWSVTSLGAASGVKSVYIDNFSNAAGNNSSLQSTVFDISGFTIPKFTFKMAYQQRATTNADKLQMLTSTDCGNTWVARWTKSGSTLATVTPPGNTPLSPSSGQFTTYTVNINGVAGSPNLRFKFEFFADPNGPGNNIFIDDINLFDAAVGIKTYEDPISVNLFPNPATDLFSITSSEIIEEISVKNVLGQSCYYAKPNHKMVSLTVDNEGLYFVTVKAGGQTTTRKLIVKR